jgi:hypothetical protein
MGKKYLEVLTRIIACVHRILVLTRVRVELAAVDLDGRKGKRAVGKLLEFAVLPLHYALGTARPLGWRGVSASVLCLMGARDIRFAMAR